MTQYHGNFLHVPRWVPGRAVDAAVVSDKCTFLRGKCKRFPVLLWLLAGTLPRRKVHVSDMTAVSTALAGTLYGVLLSL